MQQYQNVGWNGGGNNLNITFSPTGTDQVPSVAGGTTQSLTNPGTYLQGSGPGSTIAVSGWGNGTGAGFSTSAYSGIGVYKVGLDDPQIEASVAAGGQDTMAANDPWWNTGGVGSGTLHQQPLENMNPTVWALLNQVGSPCALNTVVADMVQRIDQIVPGTTQMQVQQLLTSGNATLNMGSKLYIYKVNPNDPTPSGGIHGLMISSTPPTDNVSTATADGSSTAGSCSATYQLSAGSDQGGLIDSFGNFVNGGDNNIHEEPFLKQTALNNNNAPPPLPFNATDHADFIMSSGYQNLLGQLSFYQQIQGSEAFSRPN
jgi:hypothetical protein